MKHTRALCVLLTLVIVAGLCSCKRAPDETAQTDTDVAVENAAPEAAGSEETVTEVAAARPDNSDDQKEESKPVEATAAAEPKEVRAAPEKIAVDGSVPETEKQDNETASVGAEEEKNEKSENDNGGFEFISSDSVPITVNNSPYTDELFVGEVLSAGEAAERKFDTASFTVNGKQREKLNSVIYKVRVISTVRNSFAESDGVVRVARIIDEWGQEPLEVGKTYLFGASICASAKTVMFIDTGLVTSEIKDGELIPGSPSAKGTLDYLHVKTLEEFQNSPDISPLPEERFVPSTFLMRITAPYENSVPGIEEDAMRDVDAAETEREKVIVILKHAVQFDSPIRLAA